MNNSLFAGFFTDHLYHFVACILVVLTTVVYFVTRKKKAAQLVRQRTEDSDYMRGEPKYRFRKRDKVRFYARSIYRTVKNFSERNTGPKAREKIRRRFLSRASRDNALKHHHVQRKPPSYLLEADTSKAPIEEGLPHEIVFMLKNIRVFGHFDAPLFAELCKYMVTKRYEAGEYLFRPGDKDDTIYVVESGQISVFIRFNESEDIEVKRVNAGESVFSLLSVLDVLSGHERPFRSVSARANSDTVVLLLGANAFSEVFDKFPEQWVRAVQIIMLRLQRVTLYTLHDYLGLSGELTKPTLRTVTRMRRPSGPVSTHTSTSDSPTKVLQRSASLKRSGDDHATHPPKISEGRHGSVSFFEPDDKDTIIRERHHSGKQSAKAPHILFAEYIGLDDPAMIEHDLEIKEFQPGNVITEQNSMNISLVYVLHGCIELIQSVPGEDCERVTGIVHSRELIGGLAALTGEPSFYTLRAHHFTRAAMLRKDLFYSLIANKPRIILNVAHSMVLRVSPFIRAIDFALDWEMIDANKPLYVQGSPSDSLYLVLSGRLRSVIRREGKESLELVEEFGRGDLVGMVEVLTQQPRATTVMAVRYTEMAKLPDGLLNFIKLMHPQVLTRIISLLGKCILSQRQLQASQQEAIMTANLTNINTIALVAISNDVPLLAFGLELSHALSSIKSSLRLSSDLILKEMGPTALHNVNDYRLFGWLSQQEDNYKIVVYQCDYELTPWTLRCIKQADIILYIGNGSNLPSEHGPVEQQLGTMKSVRAQKNLVLLWRDNEHPLRTAEWLSDRGWISSHYHIKAPNRMFARRSTAKIMALYEKLLQQSVDRFSDFARIARAMTGRSVGLVLGGGGARGASHIGVIKAMKDRGIPIDTVCGTSMGAFVSALYADTIDLPRVIQRAQGWFQEMSSVWKRLFDLTYPTSAVFSGAGFNNTLRAVFRGRQIEDLWLPFFCISTDITSSEMRVHTADEIWRYIRASMTYCGALPPICDPRDGHLLVDGCFVNNLPGSLWRFVRSSMSLAGYLPPLCSPDDGHLLLDGGYVNNVPADVMRSMGINAIIAVDVGGQDEKNLTNYGDSLSGWWVLWKKLNPFAEPVKVLSMAEIQSRLAYVSCVRQLEQVKKDKFCYYLRPPIDKYQTLDFHLMREISEVGYVYACEILQRHEHDEKFQQLFGNKPRSLSSAEPLQHCPNDITTMAVGAASTTRKSSVPHETKMDMGRGGGHKLNSPLNQGGSFTDLAAMVSRIQVPVPCLSDLSETDEYDTDYTDEDDVKSTASLDEYRRRKTDQDSDAGSISGNVSDQGSSPAKTERNEAFESYRSRMIKRVGENEKN